MLYRAKFGAGHASPLSRATPISTQSVLGD